MMGDAADAASQKMDSTFRSWGKIHGSGRMNSSG